MNILTSIFSYATGKELVMEDSSRTTDWLLTVCVWRLLTMHDIHRRRRAHLLHSHHATRVRRVHKYKLHQSIVPLRIHCVSKGQSYDQKSSMLFFRHSLLGVAVCLKIEIHKGHEIHSKTTLAKYRNPRNPQTVRNPHWQGSRQTNR